MKNLRNILHSTWKSPPELGRPITATAWDGSSDSLIVAYGPSEDNISIELVRVRQDKGIVEYCNPWFVYSKLRRTNDAGNINLSHRGMHHPLIQSCHVTRF